MNPENASGRPIANRPQVANLPHKIFVVFHIQIGLKGQPVGEGKIDEWPGHMGTGTVKNETGL